MSVIQTKERDIIKDIYFNSVLIITYFGQYLSIIAVNIWRFMEKWKIPNIELHWMIFTFPRHKMYQLAKIWQNIISRNEQYLKENIFRIIPNWIQFFGSTWSETIEKYLLTSVYFDTLYAKESKLSRTYHRY